MKSLALRPRWLLALGLATALVLLFLARGGLHGQVGDAGDKAKAEIIQDDKPAKAPEPALPIRQVVLFNSGLGYFQREGQVDGNARIDLSFPVGEINDLIKSMVLQDLGGGRISTVSYDSHDPIHKILRSFAVDLNGNPTFGQILNQARGEKIEVTRVEKNLKKEPASERLTGIIVGMEIQPRIAEKGILEEVEHLNLSTSAGLQSLRLADIVSVKFANPVLESEFQRALQVLARSHDVQKKTVSLGFDGAGKRSVRVGYVVERPIWKTSYRLRLEEGNRVTLQGWAVIENTSDEDWKDVRLVLVSGKPISFRMDLYEPLYVPRPLVEPEMFASLRPPVYDAAMGPPKGVDRPKMPAVDSGIAGGKSDGKKDIKQPRERWENILQDLKAAQEWQKDVQLRTDLGKADPKLSYDDYIGRRMEVLEKAKKKGADIAGLNFKEGIQSVATAENIGDYYQYVIDQSVTLARQKSAMLPIIDHTIEGAKVSIFNEYVHAKYPLLGLKLKNTSGKPLTQGPMTVYEGSTYAGDTRILDLVPGEERLLSYALDQTTEVKTSVKSTPGPEMSVKMGTGELSARFLLRETKTYTVNNRATVERTVIIEHPQRDDWRLLGAKPTETTRESYRFTLTVPAGASGTLEVIEEQARVDRVAATKAGAEPLYATALGVEIQPILNKSDDQLAGLKIRKGVLIPRFKTVESLTYFVQNLSDRDRVVGIDHIVRDDWVRLDAKGEAAQPGPSVHRILVKAARGGADKQEVREEKVFERPLPLKEAPDAKLREYLASAVVSEQVRAALAKALDLKTKLMVTRQSLEEKSKQFDVSNKDQARQRDNLKIIPMSSEHYKKFLDQFVAQETEILSLQKAIAALQTTAAAQEAEYERFVAAVSAE